MFILTRQPRLAYDQAAADILAAQAALTAAHASIGLCQGSERSPIPPPPPPSPSIPECKNSVDRLMILKNRKHIWEMLIRLVVVVGLVMVPMSW